MCLERTRSQEKQTLPSRAVYPHGHIHSYLEGGRICRANMEVPGYVATKLPCPLVLVLELAGNKALQTKSRVTMAKIKSSPIQLAVHSNEEIMG